MHLKSGMHEIDFGAKSVIDTMKVKYVSIKYVSTLQST